MNKYTTIIFFLCVTGLSTANAQQKGAAAQVTAQTTIGKTYALVVGISDYQSDKIPDLTFPETDAMSFINYLKSTSGGKVPDENIVALIGKDATSGNIWQKGIGYYFFNKNKFKKGDRLFLYFSGHGGSFNNGETDNAYFFVYDALHATDGDANLKISQVKDLIHALVEDGIQVILVFDACRSTSVGVSSQNVNNILEKEQGEILLVASKGGQVAYESPKLNHGVFTFYLLNGLYGKADTAPNDGHISGFEMETYLKSNVKMFSTKELNGDQSPFIKWGLSDQFESADVFSYSAKDTTIIQMNNSLKTQQLVAMRGAQSKSVDAKLQSMAISCDNAISQGNFNGAALYLQKIKENSSDERIVNRYQNNFLSQLLSIAHKYMNSDLMMKNDQVVAGFKKPNINDGFVADTTYYNVPIEALESYFSMCPVPAINPGAKSMLVYFKARKCSYLTVDKNKKLKALQELQNEIKRNPSKSYLYFAKGLLLKSLGQWNDANTDFTKATKYSPLWTQPMSLVERLDMNEEH